LCIDIVLNSFRADRSSSAGKVGTGQVEGNFFKMDANSFGLLVLDDYHTISEPLIHETLTFFIDHLPTNVHVLLLSRAEPDFPLLRWRARGELCELYGADLRFSLDETMAYLRKSLPVTRLKNEGRKMKFNMMNALITRKRRESCRKTQAGHLAAFARPEQFLSELLQRVRPLAIGQSKSAK
jgi:hypothetical protein